MQVIALALFSALLLPQDPGTGEEKEPPGWSGSVDAGLTSFGGNSSSITGTVNATGKYEGRRYDTSAFFTYAGDRTKDTLTNRSSSTSRLVTGGLNYRRYLNDAKDFFGYANGSARADVPNGLEGRRDAGLGAGYAFRWDELASDFSIEGGISYLYENNVRALATQEANARLAANLEAVLATDLSLVSNATFFQSLQTSANRYFTGDLALKYKVNRTIFLRAGGAVAWDNTPGPGFGKTDWRVEIGIGAAFGGAGK